MMTLCRHTNLIGCSIEFHWQTRECSWGKRMMTKCFYVTFSKRMLLLVLYFWQKKPACYVWKSKDVVVRHDAVSGYWELGINFWKAHFSDWKWSWPSSPVLPVKHRSSRCSGCVTFSHSLTRCWDCPRVSPGPLSSENFSFWKQWGIFTCTNCACSLWFCCINYLACPFFRQVP